MPMWFMHEEFEPRPGKVPQAYRTNEHAIPDQNQHVQSLLLYFVDILSQGGVGICESKFITWLAVTRSESCSKKHPVEGSLGRYI